MSLNPSKFQIELPSELIPVLDQLGAGKNTDERVKISIAIGLFSGHVVSLARGADIAGKSLSEFIGILQDRSISWVQYDEEELQHDVAFVKENSVDLGGSYDEGGL